MESGDTIIHTVTIGNPPWRVTIPVMVTPYIPAGHMLIYGHDHGTPVAYMTSFDTVYKVPEDIAQKFAVGIKTARLCQRLRELKQCNSTPRTSSDSS